MKTSSDASGFVLLTERVPHVVLEIRYYSDYNFVGRRIDGYEEPLALITREAADALRTVSESLYEKGYCLKVFDAYRPVCAVEHFVRWAADVSDVRMKPYFYPAVDKSELDEKGYVSSRSGHSRGSVVDLTLIDMKTGRELDMGGPFDLFSEVSHPDYAGVTREQHENRMLLQRAMMDGGFLPIKSEWWHFILKDEPYPDTYFTFPVSASSLK